MPLPQMLARAVEAGEPLELDGTLVGNVECSGAVYHSPTPLVVRSVKLHDGTEAWLCGTCEANLSVFTALLEREDGKVPWTVRREFGNVLRSLAMRGWDEADG